MRNPLRELRSFITRARQKLRSEGFFRAYGKNMLAIESVLVIALTLTFVFQIFLPAYLVQSSFGIWFVAFLLAISFHQEMFRKVVAREVCPYEVLRQIRFRSYLFKGVMLSAFVFFLLMYFWGSFFVGRMLVDIRSGLFPQEFLRIMLVIETILLFFIIILPLSLSAYFLYIISINDRERARLTFRAVLVGLALIRNEKEMKRRMLVKKYATLFRSGLLSYNKYLYSANSAHLQIIDTDIYNRKLLCIASIGDSDEQTAVLSQLRLALSSIAGKYAKDDTRRFLVALKNILRLKEEADYPSNELYSMVRPKTLFEKVKDWVTSPASKALVGLIPILAAVISIMSNLRII
jgi:hypothetical protein